MTANKENDDEDEAQGTYTTESSQMTQCNTID